MRTAATIIAAVLAITGRAPAAELKVLSSNGTSAIVRVIGADFERRTGHVLTLKIDVAALLHKEIEGGESFDVAVLTRSVVDELIAQGRIDAGSRADVARSGIGVAVRAGAAKPHIGPGGGCRARTRGRRW